MLLEDREARDNARFVVTNLTQGPKWVYERVYCQRGDAENRIKELHHGVEIDRTSCTRFWANQVRVMLTAAAHVLMQELRLACARTGSARAQAGTLRERLIKIGARVDKSVRRIVLHLPETFPFAADWRRVAQALGATTWRRRRNSPKSRTLTSVVPRVCSGGLPMKRQNAGKRARAAGGGTIARKDDRRSSRDLAGHAVALPRGSS